MYIAAVTGTRGPAVEGDAVNVENDLRVTSDSMLATLDQLAGLESAKRKLKPGTPRFQEMAREIERLAADVLSLTHDQERLGDKTRTVTVVTGKDVPPIDEIETRRDLMKILAEWRDAERRLAESKPRSAEHARAAADVGRLREEYHRTYTVQNPRGESR